eukprot:6238015-Prymnesium_polylepis.1
MVVWEAFELLRAYPIAPGRSSALIDYAVDDVMHVETSEAAATSQVQCIEGCVALSVLSFEECLKENVCLTFGIVSATGSTRSARCCGLKIVNGVVDGLGEWPYGLVDGEFQEGSITLESLSNLNPSVCGATFGIWWRLPQTDADQTVRQSELGLSLDGSQPTWTGLCVPGPPRIFAYIGAWKGQVSLSTRELGTFFGAEIKLADVWTLSAAEQHVRATQQLLEKQKSWTQLDTTALEAYATELVANVGHKYRTVRTGALGLLARQRTLTINQEKALLETLADTCVHLRAGAVHVLGKLEPGLHWLPFLLSALQHSRSVVRSAALALIRTCNPAVFGGVGELVEHMVKMLTDGRMETANAAFNALIRLTLGERTTFGYRDPKWSMAAGCVFADDSTFWRFFSEAAPKITEATSSNDDG